MAEMLSGVLQTAAFSLSATSPCVDFRRIFWIRVAETVTAGLVVPQADAKCPAGLHR